MHVPGLRKVIANYVLLGIFPEQDCPASIQNMEIYGELPKALGEKPKLFQKFLSGDTAAKDFQVEFFGNQGRCAVILVHRVTYTADGQVVPLGLATVLIRKGIELGKKG